MDRYVFMLVIVCRPGSRIQWFMKLKLINIGVAHVILNPFEFIRIRYCCRDSLSKGVGGAGVPLRDQQLALSLLLELSVQRGSLCHMIRAVLLLLELWGEGGGCRHDRDNRLQHGAGGGGGLMSAPLLPFLRRIQGIPTARTINMSRWDEV